MNVKQVTEKTAAREWKNFCIFRDALLERVKKSQDEVDHPRVTLQEGQDSLRSSFHYQLMNNEYRVYRTMHPDAQKALKTTLDYLLKFQNEEDQINVLEKYIEELDRDGQWNSQYFNDLALNEYDELCEGAVYRLRIDLMLDDKLEEEKAEKEKEEKKANEQQKRMPSPSKVLVLPVIPSKNPSAPGYIFYKNVGGVPTPTKLIDGILSPLFMAVRQGSTHKDDDWGWYTYYDWQNGAPNAIAFWEGAFNEFDAKVDAVNKLIQQELGEEYDE